MTLKKFKEFITEEEKTKVVKYCIDLSFNINESKYAGFLAYRERRENLITAQVTNLITGQFEQLLIETSLANDFDKILMASEKSQNPLVELALNLTKFWSKGRRLNVKFLNGTHFVRNKVKKYTKVWENAANISFNFIDHGGC